MEALIFMFDVACATYLCWRVFKSDPAKPDEARLGFFQYRTHGQPERSDKRARGAQNGGRPRA